jgi:hypothetical protein
MHSTDNLEDGYFGSGVWLNHSIKKYGKENFKKEILEFLPKRNVLEKRERIIINEDILKDLSCMNLMRGGYGGDTFTKNPNKEIIRKKFSKNNKGKNNPRYHKIVSDKSRKKNSKTHKHLPPFTKEHCKYKYITYWFGNGYNTLE